MWFEEYRENAENSEDDFYKFMTAQYLLVFISISVTMVCSSESELIWILQSLGRFSVAMVQEKNWFTSLE